MKTAKPLLMAVLLAVIPTLSQAIEVGAPLPSCNINKLSDNSALSLAQPGKVTYVDFWASWCPPCGESMPFLNELHEQLKDKDLVVLGINLDENKPDAEGFLAKHPVNFLIASNPDGKCPELFDVQAMPSSYLIDKHGKIRHIQRGFHSSETAEIRKKISSLLAEK